MQDGSKGRSWPLQPAGRIGLLDVDPDLVSGASSDDRGAMRADLTVPVYRISAGAMPAVPTRSGGPQLGYLVLKGLLLYEVWVCGRATAELLGPGDLFRPWTHEDSATLPVQTKWTVLEQALLADLRQLDGPALASGRDVMLG